MMNSVQEVQFLKNKLQQLQAAHSELQQNYDLLKDENKSSNMNNHSPEFWNEVESKLKNDTDGVKSLIRDKIITMKDQNAKGSTLLVNAAFFGNYEITQLCINLGADLAHDGGGVTALGLAQRWNSYHVEQLLLFSEMEANIGERIKNLASEINQQNGIVGNIMNELNKHDIKQQQSFKQMTTEMVVNIISKKLAFSDDMLCFCWKVAQENGNPLNSKLWKCIESTCADIIKGRNKKDWFWLKQCMLPSKIWYFKTKKTASATSYLYFKLLKLVQQQEKVQLTKLSENINQDASKDEVSFDTLVHWNVTKNKLTKLKQEKDGSKAYPRQDNIPNGIIAEYNKDDLNYDASNADFNGARFYDHHQYLSNLSLLARMVDDEFQASVKQIFNVNKYDNIGVIKGIQRESEEIKLNDDDEKYEQIMVEYTKGPVKALERARSKAANDYFDQDFPSSSCVLDFNRCSLVFQDIKSLLIGLESFVNKVRSYQSGSIIGIIRVKNGFQEYVKQAQYADVKLNVLIRGQTNNLVGEVQFLLSTMRNFKKIAHNLYSISREKEFITSSVSKILPSLLDLEKQNKVFAALDDVKSICGLMVYNGKEVKDIAINDRRTGSILIPIGKAGGVKAFKFMQSLLTPKEFIEHMFQEHVSTPTEYAIQANNVPIIKIILGMDQIRKVYKENDKWMHRLVHWTFRGCNVVETVEYILKIMQLSDKKVLEMIDYVYPNRKWMFHGNRIISVTIAENNVDILKKIAAVIGEKQFAKRVIQLDGLKSAMDANKEEMVKFMLSIDSIKKNYDGTNQDKLEINNIMNILSVYNDAM
eukprot:551061_1